jgi:hypothetical protein
MGLFVVAFYVVCELWGSRPPSGLLTVGGFLQMPLAAPLLLTLLGIAIAGGMFVVPLYAFLTTRVAPAAAARTIAANNIVNSGAMVAGSLAASVLSAVGVDSTDQLLLAAAMCSVSAWLGWRLYAVECRDEQAAASVGDQSATADEPAEPGHMMKTNTASVAAKYVLTTPRVSVSECCKAAVSISGDRGAAGV